MFAPPLPIEEPHEQAPPASPPAAPPAEDEDARAIDAAALSSSTLAELYFSQGFTDKAIEVYRDLLQREPDNERARTRVTELMSLDGQVARSASGGGTDGPRRGQIERTIARLEDFLAAVKRG
jgi:tetratricopeptide (TPR) repeat protein